MHCLFLNLVVWDGMKVVGKFVKRVRGAVRFIRQSPSRLQRFHECTVTPPELRNFWEETDRISPVNWTKPRLQALQVKPVETKLNICHAQNSG